MRKKSEGRSSSNRPPVADWLWRARRGAGLTQTEFADMVGAARSTVANWETGVDPVPSRAIEIAMEAFHVDGPSLGPDLRRVAMPASKPKGRIRYAGVVPCSDWGDPLVGEDYEEVDADFAGENRFTTRIRGASCHPVLQQKDTAVWEADLNPPYGVIVLAERADDHACTVKVLEFDEANGCNRLVPVNAAFDSPEAMDGWTCVARLIAILVPPGDGPPVKIGPWEPGLRPKHVHRK